MPPQALGPDHVFDHFLGVAIFETSECGEKHEWMPSNRAVLACLLRILGMYALSSKDVHEAFPLAHSRGRCGVFGDRGRNHCRDGQKLFGFLRIDLLFAGLCIVLVLFVYGNTGIEGSRARERRGDSSHRVLGAMTRELDAALCFRDCRLARAFGHAAHHAVLFGLLPFQSVDLAQDGVTVNSKIVFLDGVEFDDSTLGRYPDGLEHEILDKRGVALVCGGLQVDWQGVNGENVGGLERTTKQQACRVIYGDHNRRFWSLVAGREVV